MNGDMNYQHWSTMQTYHPALVRRGRQFTKEYLNWEMTFISVAEESWSRPIIMKRCFRMRTKVICLIVSPRSRLWILFSLLISRYGYGQSIPDSIATISIKAVAGLQFDVVRFLVKPGASVKLTLRNTDDMAHNLVITKPGAREEVVNAALQLGERGPAVNYLPKSAKILWAIPVVVPEETGSITFTAPRETGIYPYICTFPGHGSVMYGAMYVINGDLPDLKNDLNVPETRRAGELPATAHTNHTTAIAERFHPYQPKAPYLYRIFMPNASPASIAVNLPHNLSYCWDAGPCRLRYAWQGEFLDQKTLWPGKGDTQAKLIGTIFFRDKIVYPLQTDLSQKTPLVEYKGYQLINRYPEFHYTVNGIDVYELIRPQESGNGLLRRIKLPNATGYVRFFIDPDDGVTYQVSAGKWVNGHLELTPNEAREFTITMTRKRE